MKLITYSSSVHISLESFDLIWNNSNFKLIFTSDGYHLMFIGDVLVLFCFMLIVVFFFYQKGIKKPRNRTKDELTSLFLGGLNKHDKHCPWEDNNDDFLLEQIQC